MIKSAHENGHFGTKKVEGSIKQQFFIEKAKEKIQSVVDNCIPCMSSERKRGKSEGFLHTCDKGEKPLDTYHMDHLRPMVQHANYINIFL